MRSDSVSANPATLVSAPSSSSGAAPRIVEAARSTGRPLPQPTGDDSSHNQHDDPTSRWRTSPIRGVRFGALTAPGLSCLRPEQAREFLVIRKRSITNRLLRNLQEVVRSGLGGTCPETFRLITQSNLVFMDTKGSDTSRPVRAGEYLRKLIVKAGLKRHGGEIKAKMLEVMPFGVELPGGGEALVHARDAIDHLGRSGGFKDMVCLDLDLVVFVWEFRVAGHLDGVGD